MSNMEEDTKLIEAMIKEYKTFGDLHNPDFEDTNRIYEAIENIIDRNRYLETKAAAEINNEINNIKVEIFKNYIPISLIEEELKKLDKKEKQELKGLKGQDRYFVKQMYQYRKDSLQKILGKWAKNGQKIGYYCNSIPVSLVEEKIEELIKEGRHYNANKIEVLQELLEKRR